MWSAAVAFLGVAILTGAIRRLVLARGMLDVPNARSSHSRPTPRGGGVAIVLVVLAILAALLGRAGPLRAELATTVLAAALVAWVGWLDDRRGVVAGVRLLVHALAVGVVWSALEGPAARLAGEGAAAAGFILALLAIVGGTWLVNAFNFMDGIDGIAATQAVFVASTSGGLAMCAGAPFVLVAAWLAVAGAAGGFLLWNWAPARIFLGDVGSGFLGFMIAALALLSWQESTLSIATALMLVAPFLADATITLLRRMAQGDRWYTAHRSHAYQWLARRWRSHAKVTGAFAAIDLLIVLPLAILSVRRAEWAGGLAAALYGLLAMAALFAGAGRRETK